MLTDLPARYNLPIWYLLQWVPPWPPHSHTYQSFLIYFLSLCPMLQEKYTDGNVLSFLKMVSPLKAYIIYTISNRIYFMNSN